jgi:hypothetical protein
MMTKNAIFNALQELSHEDSRFVLAYMAGRNPETFEIALCALAGTLSRAAHEPPPAARRRPSNS